MDIRNMLKVATKELVARAKRHNMKSRYVYQKVLLELESSSEPIYNIEEVKGAGKKTRKFF